MNNTTIEAVVFDLDGVITDTAHYHFLAWRQLAEELGIIIDETINERLKGISRLDSLDIILQVGNRQNDFTQEEKNQLAEKKNRHYCEFLTELNKGDILPGIVPLMEAMKADGIKMGLASVSKNAGTVLKALEIESVFDYCVDAAAIQNSKPDPEIFLTACKGLNVDPRNAIGIEDAIAGVAAIKASNMFAVGVGPSLELADYRVEATAQLNWDEIKARFNKR